MHSATLYHKINLPLHPLPGGGFSDPLSRLHRERSVERGGLWGVEGSRRKFKISYHQIKPSAATSPGEGVQPFPLISTYPVPSVSLRTGKETHALNFLGMKFRRFPLPHSLERLLHLSLLPLFLPVMHLLRLLRPSPLPEQPAQRKPVCLLLL